MEQVQKTEIKKLYGYQKRDLGEIFDRIDDKPDDYKLLYQLLH